MVNHITAAEPEYDIIFAGGGATACVTAGRLIEKCPSLKILVIEYGNHTLNVAQHVQPGNFVRIQGGAKILHFQESVPSPSLDGRAPIVPSGKAVGGGSAVNFMIYTRGAASDYDDWETVYGNRGWSTKALMPLFKKMETYQDTAVNDTHGTDGPIKVSFASNNITLADNFLTAVKEYDKDRSCTDDVQDFYNCNKYGRWARYIDKETGTRSDSAHHYVYNKSSPNLSILTECQVVRVILENGRAVGVEYQIVLTANEPATQTVRARKLVVLSAGALGTPAILERSGIGSSKVLERCGIPQVVDLPGVGEQYMDHNVIFLNFLANPELETLDDLFWGTEEEISKYTDEWLKTRKGLMAQNSVDAGIKLRPSEEDVSKMSPAFQQRWKEFFANAPDKPLIVVYTASGQLLGRLDSRKKYYSICILPAYPASTGYTHITGKDPRSKAELHPGFLDHPADTDALRWSYKKCRELGRRIKNFRGELPQGHPLFLSDSAAAVVSEAAGPYSASDNDVVYTSSDDTAIDQFMRERIESSWHSCGTCAMKPRHDGGIVDERLNVYGVEGLKIADCSIFPQNVGANIYNTALVIGEKAAVLIAEDLKL